MSNDINQRDIELLADNPSQLIIHYQQLIDHIIYLFIRSGSFKFHEHGEIKQQINEELLNKLPKIQMQYHGKSQLKTYLSVIIRNICNEIARNKPKVNFSYLEDETLIREVPYNFTDSLILEDEMRRLKKALGLYYKHEARLILCLKLKFRMPFDMEDFQLLFKNFSLDDFNFFVQKISPYKEASDLTIISTLTLLFNKYENKNNTRDALRKWISIKTGELIELLNGSPPTYYYTEETFQILFEKCFCCEKEVITKIY